MTPAGRRAFDGDGHRAKRRRGQRLGGQDVFDLAGADAEGQGAECAMGAGVTVAADDGHAGLGEAQLGSDDVDDALVLVVEVEELHAELRAVLTQGVDLGAGDGVGDGAASGGRSVGTLWSAVATVRSGRRTLRPAVRSPSKACGLVISCMRCRSM